VLTTPHVDRLRGVPSSPSTPTRRLRGNAPLQARATSSTNVATDVLWPDAPRSAWTPYLLHMAAELRLLGMGAVVEQLVAFARSWCSHSGSPREQAALQMPPLMPLVNKVPRPADTPPLGSRPKSSSDLPQLVHGHGEIVAKTGRWLCTGRLQAFPPGPVQQSHRACVHNHHLGILSRVRRLGCDQTSPPKSRCSR